MGNTFVARSTDLLRYPASGPALLLHTVDSAQAGFLITAGEGVPSDGQFKPHNTDIALVIRETG